VNFDPLSVLVLAVGMISSAVASYYIGHANGYRDGYRIARSLPIGLFKQADFTIGTDGETSGIVTLADDVTLIMEEVPRGD
jgi:hypothetical protein